MSDVRSISREEAARAVTQEAGNLEHLGDIQLDVAVELGRVDMLLSEFDELEVGDAIALSKLVGASYDIRVNGHLFGEADIAVQVDQMVCRVTSVTTPPASQAATLLRDSHAEPFQAPVSQEQAEPVPGMTFVPGGSFVMGAAANDTPDNQRPERRIRLAGYYLDSFPVTNQDYGEFVAATGHRAPVHWRDRTCPTATSRHPVVNVSWDDATAYAEWAGKRLPTEAEWEKAARGTDGRQYPWGKRFLDGCCNANNVVGTTLPVDEFPRGRSPYGVWDTAGNAYEWCSDYYDEAYYKYGPRANPQGPELGNERAIRGGFYSETRANVRTTHRNSAPGNHMRDNIGFRLALSAEAVISDAPPASDGSSSPTTEDSHG
jgi:iron(II)-dependent oxidoreductase